MISTELAIIEALKPFIRVNESNNTVEIVNDYGTALVLKDLDEVTLNAFKETFRVW